MSSTPVEARYFEGKTLTIDLYPYGSDTRANGSGDTLTEETNRKGLYTATVTEALSGWHTAHVYESGTLRAVYDVYLEDDTDIHRCEDAPHRLHDEADRPKVDLIDAPNATAVTAIADEVLKRAVSNVEDTADKHSLGALVMIGTNSSIAGSTLTAKKPSDDTTFQTYTVTTSADADHITGVS